MQKLEFHFNFFSSAKRGKWQAKPGRDWATVFFGFLAIIFCVIGFHLSLFVYLLSHETFSKTEDTVFAPKRSLNQKALDRVILDFQQKSEATKKLLAEPPAITDPGR
jgi:Na+/melibiose symporter-like transporter